MLLWLELPNPKRQASSGEAVQKKVEIEISLAVVENSQLHLRKLKVELCYVPVILLLEIYLKIVCGILKIKNIITPQSSYPIIKDIPKDYVTR